MIARPFLDWKVFDEIGRAPSDEALRTVVCVCADPRLLSEDLPAGSMGVDEGESVEVDAVGCVTAEVERERLSNCTHTTIS